MQAILANLKNMTVLEQLPTLKSSVKEPQLAELQALADAIAAGM